MNRNRRGLLLSGIIIVFIFGISLVLFKSQNTTQPENKITEVASPIGEVLGEETQKPTISPTPKSRITPTPRVLSASTAATPTPTATATATATSTATPTSESTGTPATTPTPSATPTPEVEAEETSTATPTSEPTNTPSPTPTESSTPTPTPTVTPTPTSTPTQTPSPTPLPNLTITSVVRIPNSRICTGSNCSVSLTVTGMNFSSGIHATAILTNQGTGISETVGVVSSVQSTQIRVDFASLTKNKIFSLWLFYDDGREVIGTNIFDTYN